MYHTFLIQNSKLYPFPGRCPQIAGGAVRRTVGRDRQVPQGSHRHPVPAALDKGGQPGSYQGTLDKGGKQKKQSVEGKNIHLHYG